MAGVEIPSSAIPSGLKRERAFALQAQALLPASLGRTRSGKRRTVASPPPGIAVDRVRESKRRKKSAGDLTLNTLVAAAVPPSLSHGFRADTFAGGAPPAELVVDCENNGLTVVLEVDSVGTGCNGSPTSPNEKMELKMSKKIAPAKISGDAKELISTGSPEVSDLHAGSLKKHPPDLLRSEIGSNLRDVATARSGAPPDMLEAAIQDELPRAPTLSNARSANDSTLPGASSAPNSSKNSSSAISTMKTRLGKLTRKDVGLHKLVFMHDVLPEGTEVGYYLHGKKLLEGYIRGSGIHCRCCERIVSPSQFEAHAGQAPRRKPYNNIYTSNGVSLHELSVSLSKGRKKSARKSDDLCSICAVGGDLFLCDLCPRAFHKQCVGLSSVPEGQWHCRYCVNLHQRESYVASNDNAIAAGRVAGVDPIEQIYKRSIRIVRTPETEDDGCVLCNLRNFNKSEFDDNTVIICDQCEKEYHVGCLREHKMADLQELPKGEWLCCIDCRRIKASLQEFVLRGDQLLFPPPSETRWRLLRGKTAFGEMKTLLSRAVAIFHESFDPIVDASSGHDLIPPMVCGREVIGQDYGGMYCAVYTVGSSVVSAGVLRVLGSSVAELPLVATMPEHRGQGHFQSLFFCIEKLLRSLNVKHLVLPAADEAEAMWINKFGFTKVTSEELNKYLNGTRPTFFHGTSMLHKMIPCA